MHDLYDCCYNSLRCQVGAESLWVACAGPQGVPELLGNPIAASLPMQVAVSGPTQAVGGTTEAPQENLQPTAPVARRPACFADDLPKYAFPSHLTSAASCVKSWSEGFWLACNIIIQLEEVVEQLVCLLCGGAGGLTALVS